MVGYCCGCGLEFSRIPFPSALKLSLASCGRNQQHRLCRSNPLILFTHPTGNANVRHAALALHSAGLLGEYLTCISYRPGPFARALLPNRIATQLERRALPAALHGCASTRPGREVVRHIASKLNLRALTRHETGPFSVDRVYHDLDQVAARHLAKGKFSAIYAYEDGAAAAFGAAQRLGRKKLYDLPIGYWRVAHRLMTEEVELQPEWASTIPTMRDSSAKTARKDEELGLADMVLCASNFTRSTLASAPGFRAPLVVIPYGAPALPDNRPRPPRRPGDPLRVLFVGSLSQRKGLSYLFSACRELGANAVQLTVIGRHPGESCAALDRELSEVRWIPSLPHAGILDEMSRHDVFVFPSLFEGFGLVLLEAMAAGLPIISTPHTAAPDLIDDGQEGFIIPIRDSQLLAEKLDLLFRDPDRCTAMGRAARQKSQTFTWAGYGERLVAAIESTLVPLRT